MLVWCITLHSEQASGHWHAFWLLHYHAASASLSVLIRPHLSTFLLCEFIALPVTLHCSQSRFLLSLCLHSVPNYCKKKDHSCHIIGQYYANNIHPYSFPLDLSTIYSSLSHQYEERVSYNSIISIFKGIVQQKMKITLMSFQTCLTTFFFFCFF